MISAGTANATFTSLQWAAYTKEKLNGFEYPPGCRPVTKFVPDGSSHGSLHTCIRIRGPFCKVAKQTRPTAYNDYVSLIVGSSGNGYQPMDHQSHMGGSDVPFYPCSVDLPPKCPPANAPHLDPSKCSSTSLFLPLLK